MNVNGHEISEEVYNRVAARMKMGIFQQESLVPIVKAFTLLPMEGDAGSDLLASQISSSIISKEHEAGRIRGVGGNFWDCCLCVQ